MKSNVCCIFNYPAHYSYPIYAKMGIELGCHFYFGDKLPSNSEIRKLNVKELQGFQKELSTYFLTEHWHYLQGSFFLLFKYKRFLITGEPYGLSNWLLLLFGTLFGKRVYVWSHGWYGREGKVRKLLKKIFFSLAKGSFLYGNYARNLMIREGLNPNKLFIVYNSLNYMMHLQHRNSNFKSDLYKKHFNNSNPILIFIGRLTESKKIYLLLEAITVLKEKYSMLFNAVLIGKGSDEHSLRTHSKKLGIAENVWFYGSCYDEHEIGMLFTNSSICISPGEVGLTAIHSMSYGVPVITHDNFNEQGPEFESIIAGETGMFFKENDVNSLGEAIKVMYQILEKDGQKIRENCYSVIDNNYNPNYQIEILKNNLR
jgi:glycosyltransferase involved in cell wall biosynthesis